MKSDRVTALPLTIRNHILSFLPLKDQIRSTSLSTKWKTVASFITHLDFNQLNFPDTVVKSHLKDIVYQTLLQHNTSSDIKLFKLTFHVDNNLFLDIKTFITFAIRHNVQNIDISVLSGKLDNFLPRSLFTATCLFSLSFSNLKLTLPQNLQVQFPSLKSLSLFTVSFRDDREAVRIFRNCPSLEELTIVGCYFTTPHVLKFPGPNLRFLKLLGLSRFHEIDFSFPRLREIVYSGNPPVIREETLSCLSNAAFEFASPPKDFNGIDRNLIECRAFEILERVGNVRKLALEGLYIEFLTRHQELLARLPTSCATVKHLKLDLYPDKKPVEVVMFLLRRYPNLQTLCISIKTLSLTSMGNMGGQIPLEELNGQSMLKCLRKVEIKYFGGSGSELDLVRFLLGNGSVMKEMDITYSPHKRTNKASRTFLNDMVLAFTKVSPDVAISFS